MVNPMAGWMEINGWMDSYLMLVGPFFGGGLDYKMGELCTIAWFHPMFLHIRLVMRAVSYFLLGWDESFVLAVVDSWPELLRQEISVMAWAFATLNFRHQALLGDYLRDQTVSIFLNAAATFNIRPCIGAGSSSKEALGCMPSSACQALSCETAQTATIISSQVARSHDVANRKVFLNGPGQNLASWRFPIQLGHLRALLFATTGGSPGLIHADPVRLEVSAAEVDE